MNFFPMKQPKFEKWTKFARQSSRKVKFGLNERRNVSGISGYFISVNHHSIDQFIELLVNVQSLNSTYKLLK